MNSANNNSTLTERDVRRRFDRAAPRFDSVDFVHSVTREGLLNRLLPMTVAARLVVDLGAATGSADRLLARRFRGARVIGVDLSRDMLALAVRKKPWFSKMSYVQARATSLPFADASVDVVFANQLLPWIPDPAPVFAEVSRVLRADGLFLFATLGPDSLGLLRQAWAAVDDKPHVNHFIDMHNIGDAAVRAGLRDPVLDVDHMSVTYESTAALFRDLTAMGARNSLAGRDPSLAGAHRLKAMIQALESVVRDGVLTLDLELVYGHCWGSGQRAGGSEYRVTPGEIGRRGR